MRRSSSFRSASSSPTASPRAWPGVLDNAFVWNSTTTGALGPAYADVFRRTAAWRALGRRDHASIGFRCALDGRYRRTLVLLFVVIPVLTSF
jgi:hypothetical protein